MSYKVNIDNFERDDWEQCAREFADYSIYQTWPYQQIRGEMDGQQVSRVIVSDDDGHAVMMCQIRIKHVKTLGLKVGYVQWGPLVRGIDGTFRYCVESLKALRTAYVGTKVNVLRIVPNVCDSDVGKSISDMLISSGFDPVCSLSPYRTFVLRVDDSEEGIRKRLRKSFRRDLKKAEKAGIEIREGCDETFCEILEGLYLESLRRKCFKGPDVQEFTRPQRLLAPAEKMNVIVAYHDGEPVSALLVSHLGNTAIALLAASNEHGLSCGSSRLVWYRSAISALNAGMKRYDLGGIDPQKNPTVFEFKRRMGGEECFYIGVFDACSSLHARIIWRACEGIYNLVKK